MKSKFDEFLIKFSAAPSIFRQKLTDVDESAAKLAVHRTVPAHVLNKSRYCKARQSPENSILRGI